MKGLDKYFDKTSIGYIVPLHDRTHIVIDTNRYRYSHFARHQLPVFPIASTHNYDCRFGISHTRVLHPLTFQHWRNQGKKTVTFNLPSKLNTFIASNKKTSRPFEAQNCTKSDHVPEQVTRALSPMGGTFHPEMTKNTSILGESNR